MVSGLEHAGFAAQRALIQVLADNRVVLEGGPDLDHGRFAQRREFTRNKGKMKEEDHSDIETGTWNLPDGFIVVYVCPLDPRERPAIHKTLVSFLLLNSQHFLIALHPKLDRFSMSMTVSLRPNVRHGIQSLSGSNLYRRSSSAPALSGLGTSPSPGPPQFPPLAPEPHLPHSLIGALRDHYDHAYMPHKLALYTSDLFSAARHHQEMDGTLLTARARRETDSLVKACRVLGLSGEILAPLTAQTRRQKEQPVRRSMAGDNAGAEVTSQEEQVDHPTSAGHHRTPVLDISEADVARIVPRVISHRLRVLDSPEDQIHATAFFGAFQDGDNTRDKMFEGWVRRSVKDILVEILSTV